MLSGASDLVSFQTHFGQEMRVFRLLRGCWNALMLRSLLHMSCIAILLINHQYLRPKKVMKSVDLSAPHFHLCLNRFQLFASCWRTWYQNFHSLGMWYCSYAALQTWIHSSMLRLWALAALVHQLLIALCLSLQPFSAIANWWWMVFKESSFQE